METGLITLDEFIGLKSAGLDDDILVRNYYAARGLPGTENSNLDAWLAKRDSMAALVQLEIRRHLHRFNPQSQEEPTEYSYGNSMARFICWIALYVMQEKCGVRYHPDRKSKPDLCQPRDLFVHGIMDEDGEGGTCASMPVVYVAVLRHLGFPVFLVETRGHLFFRWDDQKGTLIQWPNLQIWIPPDRFNVDGAGEGIAYHPDSHYIQWPEPWTEDDYKHGKYLVSRNPKEEMAQFLFQRGLCLEELGRMTEALKSYHFTRQLVPDDHRYNWLHAKRSREYLAVRERLAEQVAEHALENARRSEQQRRIPGAPGHSPNCECGECNRLRDQQSRLPEIGHGESCQCFHCNQARAAMQPERLPGHSESCQCFNCKQARATAMQPTGMAGHPANCQCSGCLMQRQMPRAPSHPAFGISNQQPRHAISGPAIPGFQQQVPRLPGF